MIDYSFPMLVGNSEVPTERALTNVVESGLKMNGADSVRYIVVHCSATRASQDYTVEQLMKDHQARGFRTIGYHGYIRKDGSISYHRKWLEVGAHAKPFNRCSIGICYEGGLDENGKPADTRTLEQKYALLKLLSMLHKKFPKALIVGHRDLPGVHKSCPCFSVKEAYGFLNDASLSED